MADKKPREPFKSGVDDYAFIRNRLKEVGTEHGIDLTHKPDKEPAPTDPGHYGGEYRYP